MILKRIRDAFRALAARRQLRRQLEPHVFLRLTAELRSMAENAARSCPEQSEAQATIRDIQAEAEKLARIASEPAFRRIPRRERMMLRQGLIQSRQQLIESIQSAPSPTRTLQ